jgi:hypothetical protein
MKYLELFLGLALFGVVLGVGGILLWAVVAEFTGWWDKPANK